MPLTKKEVEQFKSRLMQMRDQIMRSIRDTKQEAQNTDEVRGHSQHQADYGTDDFDRSVNLELSAQESQILRQINRALEKIDENTYGICDITNEEISKARLEAIPYANVTVKAQEMLEKGLLEE